ncbi:hypothetical protein CKAN_02142100 [Cinnamomum micranthum f. kanehirae]|uniref:Uncharacterized protein n=1 Tax=Cinnamomum micranthum f. kanehirae TaxID=337451 RepID=A0A3S3P342_9MAGN|nr:hypothetical protein CKAN_02142100 [Cinnamomum micranthum f. kanehirae]
MRCWEAVTSAVLGVIMRKCICRIQDLWHLLTDFVSVLVTAFRFSGVARGRRWAIYDDVIIGGALKS